MDWVTVPPPQVRAEPSTASWRSVALLLACAGGILALGTFGVADREWLGAALSAVPVLIITLGHALPELLASARAGTWLSPRQWGPRGVQRVLFVLALLIAGGSQLLLAGALRDGPLQGTVLADLAYFLVLPLAAAALLVGAEARVAGWPMLRLVLDALVLASAITLFLWWAVISPATDYRDGVPLLSGLVFTAFGTAFGLSLALLTVVRERLRRLIPTAIGLALCLGADTHAGLDSLTAGARVWPWTASLLACVGLALLALGVLAYLAEPVKEVDQEEVDRRETHATSVSTISTAVLLIVGVAVDRTITDERISSLLCVAVLVFATLREVIAARLRLRTLAVLRVQAHRDPLTGLPNRRALTAQIGRLPAEQPWTVLTLDLDGFKKVNDALSHRAGDELLIQVGQVLQDQTPAPGLATRIGGDEFAILWPGGLEQGRRQAERLRQALSAVLTDHQSGVRLSASVGVGRLTLLPGRSVDRLAALVESGAALRAAKDTGRDRVVVYGGDVAAAHERELMVERRLREALVNRQIDVAVQPIVRFSDGSISGFEALARWTDAELGSVPPVEFIAVAEQTGQIIQLGEQVLRRAVGLAAAYGVFNAGITVGVNVSPVQLRQPNFLHLVRSVLTEYQVPPELLVIEVTEAILVDEDDPAATMLSALVGAGVRIAIDDFGTGYSALGYLMRLPVDVVKIDRSLTVGSVTSPRARAIVASIIQLAHGLGQRVVMEGIEDIEVAEHCERLGTDTGQGWLFGRPVPWPEAVQLLNWGPRAVAPSGPFS